MLRPFLFLVSDLRAGQRAEDQVGDVADDGLVGVAGVGGELLPGGIGDEGGPVGLKFLGVGEGEHVGEAGHARPEEGLAEEDGMQTCSLEDVELAVVEHFQFADRGCVARALVGAELEDAFGLCGCYEFWPAFEGEEQRGVDAVEGGVGGGGGPEGFGCFEEGGVEGELVVEGREFGGVLAGDEDVERGGFGADVQAEGTDRAKAEAGERGDERVGKEVLGEGRLGTHGEGVAAELVEIAGVAVRSGAHGAVGCGLGGERGRERGGEEVATVHLA